MQKCLQLDTSTNRIYGIKRDPQALNSAPTVLRTLQPRAFRSLYHVDPTVLVC